MSGFAVNSIKVVYHEDRIELRLFQASYMGDLEFGCAYIYKEDLIKFLGIDKKQDVIHNDHK